MKTAVSDGDAPSLRLARFSGRFTVAEEENVVSRDNDRRENQPAQDEPSRALQPGTQTPDFTLQRTPDHSVSLSDFRGHPVILAFILPIEVSSAVTNLNRVEGVTAEEERE